MSVFGDMDGEHRSITLSVMSVCACVAVGFICLCVNCTLTDKGFNQKVTPTTAVRLVPEEHK